MSNKRVLNWRKNDQGGRWRKVYKGRYFNRQKRDDETKDESYQRVFAEYLVWKAEIDKELAQNDPNRRAWNQLIDNATVLMERMQKMDSVENRRTYRKLAAERIVYYEMREKRVTCPITAEQASGEQLVTLDVLVPEESVLKKAPPPWETIGRQKARKTIRSHADTFLAERLPEVSPLHYERLSNSLDEFFAVVGTRKITSEGLIEFRNALQSKVDDETVKFGDEYANGRLRSVKTFIRWMYERNLIEEMPRMISSDSFRIKIAEKQIIVFSDDEIHALLEEATERTKLYITLSLNTGIRQADMSALSPSNVDWEEGRLTVKRSKTASSKAAPLVTWKLWPQTMNLLEKFAGNDDDVLIRSEGGGRLLVDEIVDGKRRKFDVIGRAFSRARKKLQERKENPIEVKGAFKAFRSSAATRLGTHEEYARYAQYFLGHAPRNVADKHYVKPSQDQFDCAVEWLGTEFFPTND